MAMGIDYRSLSRAALIALPASLLFSHGLNSLLIGVYAVGVLAQPGFFNRWRRVWQQEWIYPFLILFATQLLSIVWTSNWQEGWEVLAKKSALLVLPLSIALDSGLNRTTFHRTLELFVLACLLAFGCCLSWAARQFKAAPDPAAFFYHDLGALLDLNAVYFSLYSLVALLFLVWLSRHARGSSSPLANPFWRALAASLLIFALLLLASKLFLLLLLLLALVWGIQQAVRRAVKPSTWLLKALGIFLLVLASLWGLKAPVQRFEALLHSRMEVLQQDQFSWDTPFNGLTLRLVFIRFGMEILQEDHAFIRGVGLGDSRQQMNDTMRRHNLYLGNPSWKGDGYLNYNFHNQYLELWVQSGLPALLAFIVLLGFGLRNRRFADPPNLLLFLVMILFFFAFTESFLERQRGVVFAAFFLSLFQTRLPDEQI